MWAYFPNPQAQDALSAETWVGQLEPEAAPYVGKYVHD